MKVGTLTLPPALEAKLPFFRTTRRTLGGISGGRTSALMHVLTLAANGPDAPYIGLFSNTGREHPATLDFLRDLEAATERPLVWTEFVPPPVWGQAPRYARVREVTYDTASRDGTPFVDFLETLAQFRRQQKDLPPTAPGHKHRLCTAYLKIRTMHRWALSQGFEDYDKFVGLRADEPDRVSTLASHDRGGVAHFTPLSRAGLTKADVLAFWAAQPFDLQIPEHLGNCTACFLKDEADLAQVLYEEPIADAAWWIRVQEAYGSFRRSRRSYAEVLAEAPVRLEVVRPALARGETPVCPEGFSPRRFLLITRQEQRRLRTPSTGFSCACEGAQLAEDDGLEATLARPELDEGASS